MYELSLNVSLQAVKQIFLYIPYIWTYQYACVLVKIRSNSAKYHLWMLQI